MARRDGSRLFAAMGAAFVGVLFGAIAVYGSRRVRAPRVEPVVDQDALIDVSQHVVGIESDVGTGAGVVINDGQVVLTSAALVDGSEGIVRVIRVDGYETVGRVRVVDERHDLALVELGESMGSNAGWGSTASLRPGDPVFAWVHEPGWGPVLGQATVSVVRRRGLEPNEAHAYLQVDRELGRGPAPLFDRHGALIGLLSGSHRAASTVEHLRGFVSRSSDEPPTIGLELNEPSVLPPAIVKLGYQRGLTIRSLTAGPGLDAGLEEGDVIVAIDGRPLTADHPAERVQAIVHALYPGESLSFTVVRDGTEVQVSVTL